MKSFGHPTITTTGTSPSSNISHGKSTDSPSSTASTISSASTSPEDTFTLPSFLSTMQESAFKPFQKPSKDNSSNNSSSYIQQRFAENTAESYPDTQPYDVDELKASSDDFQNTQTALLAMTDENVEFAISLITELQKLKEVEDDDVEIGRRIGIFFRQRMRSDTMTDEVQANDAPDTHYSQTPSHSSQPRRSPSPTSQN